MDTKKLQLALTILLSGMLVSGINLMAVDFTVQAEDFVADGGGYNDGNGGGVNAEATIINFVNTGDWVEYNISVPQDGIYEAVYTVATPSANAEITYLIDGYEVSVDAIPGTGSWGNFTQVTATTRAAMTAGSHTLKLIASGTIDPWQWNLDKIVFTRTGDLIAVDVEGISISPDVINLTENQSFSMTSVVSPSNATDKGITWSSNSTSVATVDANGKITGKSEGSTMIIAETDDGGFKDSVTVNVFSSASVITIQAESFNNTGGVAYTADLGVKVNGGIGINWVNNTDWAEYSVSIPANGRYQITYYISTPSDNAEITSYIGGEVISIDAVPENGEWDNYYPLVASSEALIASGTHTFKVEASGSNAWQWNLDKIELLMVSSDLTFPVTSVSLNIQSHNLYVGDSVQLSETILPAYATDKGVTWSSDNEAVASVVDGKVKGLSEGSATITVTSDDGGLKATASITVAGARVEVSPASVSVEIQATTTIEATILPEGKVDSVIWTTENDQVATVDAYGVVTGVAQGTTKIIATLENEQVFAECVVTVTHVKEKYSIRLDNESKYYLPFASEGVLPVTTIYSAGEGKTISTALGGIRYMLREVNSAWQVLNEIKVEDPSVINTSSGTSTVNIPLTGVKPSSQLASGNGYMLFIRVLNSDLELKEISIFPVTIGPAVSTGSEDENDDIVGMYPNPVESSINLSGLEGADCSVSIYNLNGVVVKNINYSSDSEKSMSAGDLPSGYYIMNIVSGNESKTIKFCKL